METRIFKTLGNDFYNLAVNKDIKGAREIYLRYLHNAKQTPSAAKLIFDKTVSSNRNMLYANARQAAMIEGTTYPIKNAMNQDAFVSECLDKVLNDKEVKSIQKEIDKYINKMYKRTKKIRTKAELTNSDKISLDFARNERNKNWIKKLFG